MGKLDKDTARKFAEALKKSGKRTGAKLVKK
ncbi:hypothetical protein J2S74_002889 [Evansella vedderi]|uniref:Uncharacterized protein n=1 Tax=Evansella vedderi TaxID=38282 RepID=A0ABT9ZXP6_9BACI|nr:hypothetical protein [Evansella vedderi]